MTPLGVLWEIVSWWRILFLVDEGPVRCENFTRSLRTVDGKLLWCCSFPLANIVWESFVVEVIPLGDILAAMFENAFRFRFQLGNWN